MSKHTKGPWILDTISGWADGSKRDLNGDIYIRKEGDALPFGQIFTDTEEREMLDPEIIPERIAAARLIAAAPELLQALEHLKRHVAECIAQWEADGEPIDTKDHGLAVCLNNRAGDLINAALAKAKGGER